MPFRPSVRNFVQAMLKWDDKYLFLALDVTDDTHVGGDIGACYKQGVQVAFEVGGPASVDQVRAGQTWLTNKSVSHHSKRSAALDSAGLHGRALCTCDWPCRLCGPHQKEGAERRAPSSPAMPRRSSL